MLKKFLYLNGIYVDKKKRIWNTTMKWLLPKFKSCEICCLYYSRSLETLRLKGQIFIDRKNKKLSKGNIEDLRNDNYGFEGLRAILRAYLVLLYI